MSTRPSIAILGAGRAGCSLYAALTSAGQAPALLWTRSPVSAQAAKQAGFPAETGPFPNELADASLVLLAVSDDALGETAYALNGAGVLSATTVVAHLSGAKTLSALEPMKTTPHHGSFHLLSSLPSRRSAISGFAGIASATPEADAALTRLASTLALGIVRPQGDRALYHAAACMVGNYPQSLMTAALQLFAAAGISEAEGREALGPLLAGASRNAVAAAGAASLSGPIVRGDAGTVAAHLHALAERAELADAEQLYRAAGVIAAKLAAGPQEQKLLSLLTQDQTAGDGDV